MKNGLLILSLIFFTACNSDEIAELQRRLDQAESQLNTQNSAIDSTMGLLESGKCSITEVAEDSALLVCGDGTSFRIQNGEDGTNGNSCTVAQTNSGAEVHCTDGTVALITNGVDGQNGQDGDSCQVSETANGAQVICSDGSTAIISDGENGSSCFVSETAEGARVECEDGTVASISNGQNGVDGENGLNGQSCIVTEVENVGALVECGETSVVITNGENGQDAVNPVIELVDPCGDQGAFDEVLLRLSDGTLLAHYAGGGNKQFMTVLKPGRYKTTDGFSCSFTVTGDGKIVD